MVLLSLPAIYFLFVVSLMWGGIASLTLYWVIKTCRERRQRSPGGERRRIQFTLGQLMGLIVVCAVVFAALSTPFAIFVAALGIVVPGFLFDRFRGGSGIVGGMISSSASLAALGVAAYAYSYFTPDPAMLAYLGPPILTLPILGIAGAGWGALAGTSIDVIICTQKSYKTRTTMTREPSGQIVWLPDETSHHESDRHHRHGRRGSPGSPRGAHSRAEGRTGAGPGAGGRARTGPT